MTPPPAPTGPGRVRRLILVTMAAVLIVAALIHVLGGRVVTLAACAIAGTAALGGILWRLPHLRRHFASPRRGQRRAARYHRAGLPIRGNGQGRASRRSARATTGRAARARMTGSLFPRRLARPGRGSRTRPASQRMSRFMPWRKRRPGAAATPSQPKRHRRWWFARNQATTARQPRRLRLPGLAPITKAARWLRTRVGVIARKHPLRGIKPMARLWLHRTAVTLGLRKTAAVPSPQPVASATTPARPVPPAIFTEPALPENRPALHQDPVPSQGEHHMSNLEAITEAAHDNIAGFRPQSRSAVEAFFDGLPGMLCELGQSLTIAAGNIEDEFIHPSVVDMLRELGHVVAGTAETAEETFHRHATEHSLWRND